MEPLDLSWTDAQLEHEIARHVPESLEFFCEWRNVVWSARIESGSDVVHVSEHVDRRTALYAVYGYLWLKDAPPPVAGSSWDPGAARPTTASVSRYVQSLIADPDDLDPDQVAAVYGIPTDARSSESKKG